MIQNCQAQRTTSMLKPTPRVNQSGAQGASEVTLRTLFDTEETALLRFAFSLIGRRAVAEEIVQEVFLQLHARWDEVDSPRAWLYRSVRNRAYNYIRDNKRESLSRDAREVQSPHAEDETPDAHGIGRMVVQRSMQYWFAPAAADLNLGRNLTPRTCNTSGSKAC